MMLPLNPIRKAAWMAHRRCPNAVPWEDLFQECALAHLDAQRSYDFTKGKLPNWTWSVMWGRALQLQQKELPYLKNGNKTPPEPTVEPPTHLLEIVGEMSAEAQQVCCMVLSSPTEFLADAPKLARGHLYRRLRREGWTWESIWSAFREIKAALK